MASRPCQSSYIEPTHPKERNTNQELLIWQGLCTRNGLQPGFQIAGARVPKLWKQLLLLRGVECSHLVLGFRINLFGCSTISENGSEDTLVQTLRCRQIANSLSSRLVSWGLHQENHLSLSELDRDQTPQNCKCKTGSHFRKCRA